MSAMAVYLPVRDVHSGSPPLPSGSCAQRCVPEGCSLRLFCLSAPALMYRRSHSNNRELVTGTVTR